MKFLFPQAWWLALLAIPIIILYLIKTQVPRRPVSTLIFWQQTQLPAYQSSIWLKLRRWLSLLLQLLFLFLLIFALAQPLPPGASLKPRSMVIILDPSLSMSAKESNAARWDRGIQAARGIARGIGMQDSVAIIQAGPPPRILSGWTASKRTLLKTIDAARPDRQTISPEASLRLASELSAGRPESQIILISDGVWKMPKGLLATPHLSLLQVGDKSPNSGFISFSARRSPVIPAQIIVTASLQSFLDHPVKGQIELTQNGHTVDIQEVHLDPAQIWTKEWNLETSQACKFEISQTGFPADALAEDDSATCSVGEAKVLHVILVSEPNAFLEAAMKSMPLLEWKRLSPSELPMQPASDTAYIFNQSVPPPAYADVPQILLNPLESGAWGELHGNIDSPLVSEMLSDSVPMRHANFMMVSLEHAGKWRPAPGSQTWVSSFDSPLIFGDWSDRRHRIVIGFGLSQSDFALRTAFPILLANLFDSLRIAENEKTGALLSAVESSLNPSENISQISRTPAPATSIFARFPLWWWFVILGIVWLLSEWWSFTRRITE